MACQRVSDMSFSKKSPGNFGNNAGKRNLPSWMSSQENKNESFEKKPAGDCQGEESNGSGKTKQAKGHGKQCTGSGSTSAKENSKTSATSSAATNFSKLLVLNHKFYDFAWFLLF